MQIEPVIFTEAERDQWWVEQQARAAEADGLEDPPEVEVVAWMTTRGEQSEALAECLQEAGFSAIPQPGGGIRYEPGVPEAQEEALALARYICEGMYPLDPTYAQEWTEDQVGLIYDYWEEYFIPCVEAHGYPVDTTGQPTREAYVAAFHTAERISWWPSEQFARQPLEVQQSLNEVCPPYPPDEAMYGTSG